MMKTFTVLEVSAGFSSGRGRSAATPSVSKLVIISAKGPTNRVREYFIMEYFTLVSKNRENADRLLGMLADIRDAGGYPALAFQP